MEISFNNSASKGVGVADQQPTPLSTQAPNHLNTQPLNQLTISHATASPEDIAAAGIPDAALSRDDALGKLIGVAFGLPPPPMPF